jgi:alpha-beta hydrolase superfamily lysophospholipase
MYSKIFFSAFIFSALIAHGQFLDPLPRQAYWGANFRPPGPLNGGATVINVLPNGFADKSGLKQGDIIFTINNEPIDNRSSYFMIMSKIKGNTGVELQVLSQGKLKKITGILPSMPVEKYKAVKTEYKSVMSPYGYRVQVIINRPENIKEKIPAIFVVRWMSCDPIEKPVSRKHGVNLLLDDLIEKSGYAVIRVEKPGLGDSEGPSCYDADFNHELAAHKAAFESLKHLDFIDTKKIIVLGQSNGAAYAPLVVNDTKIAAYVVTGLWAKSWYEHMIEFLRKKYELDGFSVNEINQRMKSVIEFYNHYLIYKERPIDILNQKPHLKQIWDDEADHQYGLPFAYFHQLQDLNITSIWNRVNLQVLVLYGEYDFLMSKEDHEKIAEIVNRNNPGMATFHLMPHMHHSLFKFNSVQEGYKDFNEKGRYDDEVSLNIIRWMSQVLK